MQKICDDAKESMQLWVSEFMSIITIEANKRCKAEFRKIVNAGDLIWAMNMLKFEHYAKSLLFSTKTITTVVVVANIDMQFNVLVTINTPSR
jgi:hypothetical protein